MKITINISLKLFIFLICIIYINSRDTPSTNLGVIPFKILFNQNIPNENDFTVNDYLDIIHSSKPYLEIEVGNIKSSINLNIVNKNIKIKNGKQILLLLLLLDESTFYIDDNYFLNEEKNNLICQYSNKLSSSYESRDYFPNEFKFSIFAADYFKIYSNLNLDKYQEIQILFRHFLLASKNITFSCGKAGLLYHSEKNENSDENFIYQLHSKLNNVDYSFMFKFNAQKNLDDNENGLFIMGAESYYKNENNFTYFH